MSCKVFQTGIVLGKYACLNDSVLHLEERKDSEFVLVVVRIGFR